MPAESVPIPWDLHSCRRHLAVLMFRCTGTRRTNQVPVCLVSTRAQSQSQRNMWLCGALHSSFVSLSHMIPSFTTPHTSHWHHGGVWRRRWRPMISTRRRRGLVCLCVTFFSGGCLWFWALVPCFPCVYEVSKAEHRSGLTFNIHLVQCIRDCITMQGKLLMISSFRSRKRTTSKHISSRLIIDLGFWGCVTQNRDT